MQYIKFQEQMIRWKDSKRDNILFRKRAWNYNFRKKGN